VILSILVFWGATLLAAPPENCRDCHRVTVSGPHRTLSCGSCHGNDRETVTAPAAAVRAARECVACHRGKERIFSHPMAVREGERLFVARTWGRHDPRFWETNCSGCHLTGCLDCHGSGHAITPPSDDRCLVCHRAPYTGSDYHGIAPREDNTRYQRGRVRFGQKGLTMRPDIHAERGVPCRRCHTMGSFLDGKRSARGCSDCHTPSRRVVEHRIGEHLTSMTCQSCHAAWSPQEYGTFFIRFIESDSSDFDLATKRGEYARSAYLRTQDSPPLGIDRSGRYAPIRPLFIAYYTELFRNRPRVENLLLAAEWVPTAPHTIRRGGPLCGDCHDSRRRFLLEPEQDRIYDLLTDGMELSSFWNQRGQTIRGGRFVTPEEGERIFRRTPRHVRGEIEKWNEVTTGGGRR